MSGNKKQSLLQEYSVASDELNKNWVFLLIYQKH
jgi:hypothetical protein